MLPFEPEPITRLISRFPLSVDRVMDVQAIRTDPALRPGNERRHVFDFVHGLRLIVSVDDYGAEPPGGVQLHVSASVHPRSCLDELLRSPCQCLGDQVRENFGRLCGAMERPGKLKLLGVSTGSIPHWFAQVPRSWPVAPAVQRSNHHQSRELARAN